MILTDESKLRVKCEPVLSGEVHDLRVKLEEALEWSAKRGFPGVGLACPQIGIPKSMAIVRVDNSIKLDLVNADVTKGYYPYQFDGEGCLSFPNRYESTIRYKEIVVEGNLVWPYRFIATDFVAVVVQHECLSSDAILITENGPSKISTIVSNRYSGKILTIDNNGIEHFTSVVNWSRKINNGKQWVRVKTSKTGPNKQLKCTSDHQCGVVDDILNNPTISFVPAKDLKGRFIVRRTINRSRNSETSLYNKDQVSAIIGGLLGDLCISSRGEVSISHGRGHKEYAQKKAELLNGFTRPSFSGFMNAWTNTTVIAPITEQTKLLRRIMYNPKKSVKGITQYINEISLAFWYMDDGDLVRGKNARIHTEGFTDDDVLLLKCRLNDFGIDPSIYHRKVRGVNRPYLYFKISDSKLLFEMISPYIYTCMNYKLPIEFRNVKVKNLNMRRLLYSAKLVTEVVPVFCQSALFDIEVADHHSFFANDTLVHNCDHLNRILLSDRAIK